jgi:hypothetical protein
MRDGRSEGIMNNAQKPMTLADLSLRELRAICEARGINEVEVERESISDSKGNSLEMIRTFRIKDTP